VTLAPLIDPSVRGVDGKPSVVTDRCVAPDCEDYARERHHLWSRSYLRGQPQEWVSVQGSVIPNVVGLCYHHHRQVTGTHGHPVHIRWNEGLKLLEWWENQGDYIEPDRWVSRGPLKSQGILPAAPVPPRARAVEVCDGCGRPKVKKREALPPGEARKVKTWAITVPDDSEEGAEVLDTNIEYLGERMGYHDMSTRLLRYHVLVPVLAWVIQNQQAFIGDWEEAMDA
jgi:hypothetical protein